MNVSFQGRNLVFGLNPITASLKRVRGQDRAPPSELESRPIDDPSTSVKIREFHQKMFPITAGLRHVGTDSFAIGHTGKNSGHFLSGQESAQLSGGFVNR